jgi:hypothetical protein
MNRLEDRLHPHLIPADISLLVWSSLVPVVRRHRKGSSERSYRDIRLAKFNAVTPASGCPHYDLRHSSYPLLLHSALN